MRNRRSSNNGLYSIIGTAILLVTLACGSLIGIPGCGEYLYTRDVKGKVVNSGSRWKARQHGGDEKIALKLSPYTAGSVVVNTAGDGDTLWVECVSTRCAALEADECVDLVCKVDRRIFEPSVVMCKMDKSADCAALK